MISLDHHARSTFPLMSGRWSGIFSRVVWAMEVQGSYSSFCLFLVSITPTITMHIQDAIARTWHTLLVETVGCHVAVTALMWPPLSFPQRMGSSTISQTGGQHNVSTVPCASCEHVPTFQL